ncbi:GGDEF domain-containing protein [Pseudoalteromonas aurantia]|uniref:Diguanylate cyclase DosC n=1 Tax=Pseudoalteromonas aurantia 208 TaxID=1314867 RepID=A0ABR9EIH2_9GAMM|nr:GGDEF domain-containing protein [Pseudoalteromonas aurantia]MBE0370796.1 hypothetical protein [Pseudoalteromonas aurantia 208]
MTDRIHQTLVEQYQISELEIQTRKNLFELSDDELEFLNKYRLVIDGHLDEVVAHFYTLLSKDEYVGLLIGDSETFERLKSGLHKYVLDLFSGFYDAEYVNNRLRIGLVHKRIGLEPKYFLSAERYLRQSIDVTLQTLVDDPVITGKISSILEKLIAFDMSWIFDTYISSMLNEMNSLKLKTDLYVKSLEERIRGLSRLASKDPLTDLYNVRSFRDFLRRELLLAKRSHASISIVYFDIDDFKEINDKCGHKEGDNVLKSIGKILMSIARETDIASRQGGDEFCLALIGCELSEAQAISKRLVEKFAAEFPHYALSIGIAELQDQTDLDVDGVIHRADQKMYQAKKSKGCKICS